MGAGLALQLLLRQEAPMDEIAFSNGLRYRTHDALHSGYGPVGVANHRVLLKQFEGHVEQWTQAELHDELLEIATPRWAHQMDESGTCKDDCQIAIHRLPVEDCLLVTDALGTSALYLRSPDFADILDALDNYAVLDDSVASQVAAELEEEAWLRWIRAEIMEGIKDPALLDWVDGYVDDATLFAMYRTVVARDGYPEIDAREVARLAPEFERLVRAHAATNFERTFNEAEAL